MYEPFYGLKEKPFTLLPDPDYLYLSPKHQRALTLLEYGMMNQAGFSVICGDTGAGKTTLIRRLLSELGDDTKVGLITNTHHSFGELLNWVLMAFGLDSDGKSKAQMHQMFIEFLIDQYAQNKHTVLIVDEAQNMSADTLEELRMLSNINADKDQVLQVILAGQPALRETLRQPELMQFAQRIAVDYYLESLSAEETQAYIEHRLGVAGAQKTIFTKDACEAIFKYSGGTPRLINLLCDTALVYGYAEQSQTINEQLVHDVVREQHSNSIIPTFNTSQPVKDAVVEEEKQKFEGQSAESQQGVNTALENDALEKQKVDSSLAGATQQGIQQTTAASMVTGSASRAASHAVTARAEGADHSIQLKHTDKTASENRRTMKASTDTVAEHSAEKGQQEKVLKDDSNVTHIKVMLSEDNTIQESQDKFTKTIRSNMDELKGDESAFSDSQSEPSSAGQTTTTQQNKHRSKKEETIKAETIEEGLNKSESFDMEDNENMSQQNKGEAKHFTERRHAPDDAYPIVHVEENPKKGLSMILMALVGGMFVASVIMMGAAWIMFGSSDKNKQVVSSQDLNLRASKDIENRELIALQKERDAALAVNRALERERDAALQAAKAQEEIRAAELRAAETLAAQKREASKRLQEARARARVAEQAESEARAREYRLKLKTEKKEAELERQRQQMLQEEKRRLDALALEEQQLERQQLENKRARSATEKPATTQQQPVVVEDRVAKESKADIKSEKKESFSANPCNSASAKFLSTCKK